MGIGERKTKRKGGKITRSRIVRVYVDTGEKYSSGRKKYKQVVRTAGSKISTSHAQAWEKYEEEQTRQQQIAEGGGPICIQEAMAELVSERRLQDRSWKRYQVLIKQLTGFFGDIYLDELTEKLCRQYRDHRLSQGKAFATVDFELAAIRHIIFRAIRNKRCSLKENPVNKYVTIRKSNMRDRVLEVEEEAILLPVMHWRPSLMSEAILLSGMRPGEAIRLFKPLSTASNISNHEGIGYIDLRANVLRLNKTKTLKAREVKIGPRLREIFIQSMQDNDYNEVFLNTRDKPWAHVHDFDDYFRRHCKKIGLYNLKPHDLRHTYATRLVRSNVNISRVQYYLGHKSVKTTERYVHIDTYSDEDVLISESFGEEAKKLARHNKNHNKLHLTED